MESCISGLKTDQLLFTCVPEILKRKFSLDFGHSFDESCLVRFNNVICIIIQYFHDVNNYHKNLPSVDEE